MAVRHGYGKIAGTDALVFAYDTGDTRNSYRGEPTTNLISGVANPTLSTSGWYSTGWNGNISIDTDEGALVLNATNGWRSMSYDFGVTNGTVTVQFDYKLKSAEHTNIYMIVLNGTHLGSYTQALADELSTGTIYPSLNEYKTFRKTFNTTTDSKICIVLRGTDNAGLTDEMFIKNLQVEQKSHATPFVNGTRSATQGLLDLTGNNTIDLSNVSFDSNAQKTFDGTNDFVDTGYSGGDIATPTLEAVVYRSTSTGRYEAIIQNNVATDDALYVYPAGNLGFWPCAASDLTVPTGQWSHVAVSYDGTDLTYIVNGTVQIVTATCTHITDWDFLRIGAHSTGDSERWIGEIAVVKVYNRALTASELLSNYRHYKNRFGM